MQSNCDVILTEVPDDKEILVAKIIYRVLGLNAKDAKVLVKSVPIALIERVSREEAEALQQELEQVGAKVNIKKTAGFKPSETSQPPDVLQLDEATVIDKYYSALASVNCKYQELLQARNELKWYQRQIQDADELAIQLGFENTSKLPISRFPLSNPLLRSQVKLALANAHAKLAEYKNTMRQRDETISHLQEKFNETISHLRKQRDETISRLQRELSSTISSSNYELQNLVRNMENTISTRESLKTKKLIEILLIIGVGILTAFLSRNFWLILVFILITWGIRSNMD